MPLDSVGVGDHDRFHSSCRGRIMKTSLIVMMLPFVVTAQTPAQFGGTTLTPPALNTNPGPIYWPRMRIWQGIPSIERTAKGRLWATWYCGPLTEGLRGEGNYAVLVSSIDDGK